ncbi:MAG: site-specific DNA-methyltransferase [Chloroflexi bacterium]|nr:site-specific DNA-methyltransferase [Chloroflexota bacterium]
MTYEQQFLDALKSIFIGAKVEGDSGYINLMKIKANYFEKGVFPVLMKDIDSACKPFEKGFREELFDKLYDFFQHYFSESGSIYFRNTAQHHNIYEKVYTDDRDVMLFWKTHMLYYVKTDRLFNSMEIEVDGGKFFFDVSGMELKRSNEKRELTYTFKSIKNGVITLTVGYSEKGRKTKIDEIVKAIKADDGRRTVDDEILAKAFRVFEKQSEVDYFINKNAKAFLQEQFDLWMYQYIFKGESEFNETRLKQLQAMKGIATKIIDFIAQFEDELVRVWNKPKFALNSAYIITLDKILGTKTSEVSKTSEVWRKLAKHKGMKDQIAEWIELGMVDETFKLDLILEKNLLKEPANPQYQYLPLDTKYFKDLELDILALFDDLDSALDGWLIHSENYQALNTLLPKFRKKVDVIYIDPPYNTAASEIIYTNNYKDSSWLTLIDNRLEIGKSFLAQESFLCVTIDDFQLHRLRGLLNLTFGDNAVLGTVAIKNNPAGRSTAKGFSIAHEYAVFVTNSDDATIGRLERTEEQIARYNERDDKGRYEWVNFRKHGGANALRTARPKLFYPIYVTEKGLRIPKIKWDEIKGEWTALEKPTPKETVLFPLSAEGEERTWKWGHESAQKNIEDFKVHNDQQGKLGVYMKGRMNEEGTLPLTWWDKSLYSASDYGTNLLKNIFGEGQKFSFPKSVHATSDCIRVANPDDEIMILDFFGGSGTTAHAAMNLNRADSGKRKYILVEMGEHFNTVILPRVKKVAFSSKWKDGKAQTSEAPKNGETSEVSTGISHFAKYFELEQYEDALKKARYEDAPLFQGTQDAYTSYVFLRDLKMLEAVKVNKKQNQVEVSLNRLYDGIDLAETLSCLTGKWIKRITKDSVEFQDGASASLSAPEWDDVKPLIWW